LFSRVLVPQAVLLELLHEDAPLAVRAWASNPPEWISIEQTPDAMFGGMEKLQAGERAAIFLAESANADIIVIDERPQGLSRDNEGSLLPALGRAHSSRNEKPGESAGCPKHESAGRARND
jgi:hypothetical protein